MSSQAIIDAFYAKLVAVQTVGSLYFALGGRIYNTIAPQNAALPLLVYNIISDSDDRNYGSVTHQMQVQVDLYGKIELGAKALGDIESKLYALLFNASITPVGFDRGVCTFTSRMQLSQDEDAFRITDELTITGTI